MLTSVTSLQPRDALGLCPALEEGHVIAVQAEDLSGTRKMIPDLATWLQCLYTQEAIYILLTKVCHQIIRLVITFHT